MFIVHLAYSKIIKTSKERNNIIIDDFKIPKTKTERSKKHKFINCRFRGEIGLIRSYN